MQRLPLTKPIGSELHVAKPITPAFRSNCAHQNHRFPLFAAYRNSSRCRPREFRPVKAAVDETEILGVPENAFTPGAESGARQKLFNNIAPVYDELNDKLSFGQHKVWKKMAVKWSGAQAGGRALDVCCGSGDLAFLLANAVGPSGQVVGLDFAAEMLEDAAAREQQLNRAAPRSQRTPLRWVQGDALQLPFGSSEFDAATLAYGLRNVADIPRALRELHRVLKPGCRAAVLDFNNSTDATVDAVQEWFLANLVVPAAESYGLGDEYRYLRPSIKKFPTGREQEQLGLQAGFSKAVHYDVSFGLMGCLVLTK